jgi:signal transduction histidine kinase/DNA-binding response OmpR family regulator
MIGKRMRHMWLALLLAMIVSGVQASMVALDETAEQIDLSNYLALLHDPAGKLHYTEVLSMNTEFRTARRQDLIRSFNAGVFWVRFSLLHTGAQPITRWLVVGTPKINTVTLYLQNGQDWQVMQSGRNVPVGQKPIVATDAAFPITLAPGQNREILVRVVARGATDMATSLWKPEAYRSVSGEGKLLLVGMLAGLLVSAALSLIVFVRLREAQYLWMALFLIGIAGLEMARENLIGLYFWPENIAVPLQILAMFGGMAVFALAKVISYALDLPRNFIPAEKLFLVARWLGLGAVFLSGFDYGLGVRLLAITALVVHFGGLVLPAVLWRRGIPSAGWFALSFGLGLLLESLRQLTNLGILPWSDAMHFSLVGYLLAAPFILVGMMEQTRRLSEQLAVVTQLQQAKSAFLARVSHELRSPLNTILGFSRMLHRNSTRLSLQEGTTAIEKSALRLLGLVDELLDESRAAAGQLTVSPTPTLFQPWLDEICESAQVFCAAQGNRFSCERSGKLPEALIIDSDRLRQVLENLLSNANRHTSRGEICLQCAAWSENEMAVLNFAVSDTGEGIAPDQLESIFEPFVRGKEANNGDGRRRSGFGLGLSICRELIHQMGGKISVSSTLKKGSRFSFTLRCRQVDSSALLILPDGAPERDHAAAVTHFPTMDPVSTQPRVLVVDDDSLQLSLLGDMLEEFGLAVVTADGGRSAINRLDQDGWDIVITDQMMPEVDGWAVLGHSRATRPQRPVILLSAAEPCRPASVAADLTFDAALLKPVASEDVLATVWRLILKVGGSGTAISDEQLQILAKLASDGDVSGIEDWIAVQPASCATAWIQCALNRLQFDLLQRFILSK